MSTEKLEKLLSREKELKARIAKEKRKAAEDARKKSMADIIRLGEICIQAGLGEFTSAELKKPLAAVQEKLATAAQKSAPSADKE